MTLHHVHAVAARLTTLPGKLASGFWLLASLLSGCAAVGHVTELPQGVYEVAHLGGNDSLRHTFRHQRALARLSADTLYLTPYDVRASSPPPPRPYRLHPDHHAVLLDRRFDLDVFTLPFKVRAARAGIPPQLNSSFNAALYLGRRFDFYDLRLDRRAAAWQHAPRLKATGLGYGAFLGVGSAFISPDLTRQHATLDYDGLVVNLGLATIYDARAFNVGLALGLDHLAGRDRRHWVYQNKPWLGVLFGLDLN